MNQRSASITTGSLCDDERCNQSIPGNVSLFFGSTQSQSPFTATITVWVSSVWSVLIYQMKRKKKKNGATDKMYITFPRDIQYLDAIFRKFNAIYDISARYSIVQCDTPQFDSSTRYIIIRCDFRCFGAIFKKSGRYFKWCSVFRCDTLVILTRNSIFKAKFDILNCDNRGFDVIFDMISRWDIQNFQ